MNKKEPEIFTSLKKFVELAEKLKETMVEYDNLQSANEKNNCSENQKKHPTIPLSVIARCFLQLLAPSPSF